MPQICENIKKYRQLRKFSQQQIADKIGEKRSTYAGWESSIVPQADALIKIARALDVTVDDILAGSSTPKPFGQGPGGEAAYQKALTSVLLHAVAELLAATSGENTEVVRRRLEKAAEEISRMDG